MTDYSDTALLTGMTFSSPPRPNAVFRLAKDANVEFHLCCRYPSAWSRFWQRVFFGFIWERPK